MTGFNPDLTINHDVTIEGNMVTLRPLRPEHVGKAYVAWLNDPEVTEFTELPRGGHDLASVRRYVEEGAGR